MIIGIHQCSRSQWLNKLLFVLSFISSKQKNQQEPTAVTFFCIFNKEKLTVSELQALIGHQHLMKKWNRHVRGAAGSESLICSCFNDTVDLASQESG